MASSSALHHFPQWQTLKDKLKEDIYDGELWNQLVNHHENLVADHQRLFNTRGDLKRLLYADFELLLAKFPYYTLYWRRYVAVVLSLDGIEASAKILERAIYVFPHSLDLWTDYINDLVTNDFKPVEEIKSIMEKGGEYIGRNFLSHGYWDIYLTFVAKVDGRNSNDYINILLKIIKLPLHQYSRYYETFLELMSNFTIHDLIPSEVLNEWITKTYGDSDIESQIESKSNEIIDQYFQANFKTVQKLTNEKWKYESQLKKIDFDFNLITPDELQPWIDYLAYEEEQGNKLATISLFERALAPTCLLKDVWIKYTRFLIHKEADHSLITKIFNKACDQFVPSDVLDLRYMYAKFLELIKKDSDAVKRVYVTTISKNNTNCDPVCKYLNYLINTSEDKKLLIEDITAAVHLYHKEHVLEKQNDEGDKLLKKRKPNVVHNTKIQNKCIEELYNVLSYRTIGQLLVTAARYHWLTEQNVELTRDLLSIFFKTELVKCNKEYWFFYFKFEYTQRKKSALTNIINYIKLHSQLNPSDINILLKQYMEFMFKNSTLEELNKNRKEYHRIMLETDVESSTHERRFHNFRISPDNNEETVNKRLFKENGHPSATCEGIPITTNPIPLKESLFGFRQEIPIGIEKGKPIFKSKTITDPLPQFRNVEKANSLLKYTRESI